ncbi:hypothetical protein [Actinomycetospora sp. CA-084318]|uniref:hypothetical protein n=1 Tax=Actinomycetospora sp. CA-084318 TaxID=3239892 RepID=UPI003D98C038
MGRLVAGRRVWTSASITGLALLGVFPSTGVASAAPGDVNCTDFTYQQDAQAVYQRYAPADPFGLDADDDGLACESLPTRPGAPIGTQPVRPAPIVLPPGVSTDCVEVRDAQTALREAELAHARADVALRAARKALADAEHDVRTETRNVATAEKELSDKQSRLDRLLATVPPPKSSIPGDLVSDPVGQLIWEREIAEARDRVRLAEMGVSGSARLLAVFESNLLERRAELDPAQRIATAALAQLTHARAAAQAFCPPVTPGSPPTPPPVNGGTIPGPTPTDSGSTSNPGLPGNSPGNPPPSTTAAWFSAAGHGVKLDDAMSPLSPADATTSPVPEVGGAARFPVGGVEAGDGPGSGVNPFHIGLAAAGLSALGLSVATARRAREHL